MVARGDLGDARLRVQSSMSERRSDRDYLLDRMRLGIVSLADGVPSAGGEAFREAYEMLRTQGLNQDKTLAIAMVGDQAALWKGEPFEQAMAYHYYGVWNATQGEWHNARAAAGQSLFNLKDFGDGWRGRRKRTEDLIRASRGNDRYFETGYVAARTDFALGYLMNGIANQQIGRLDEARDNFDEAVAVNADLRPMISELESRDYNTILVVDYGPGPEKYARGPDNAIADFRPLVSSDDRRLVVTVDGRASEYPVACDLNALSADHMWKGIEDIRIAKSRVGDLFLATGAATSIAGSSYGSNEAAIAGLAIMLIGMLQKATAHADTTYCEVMPQRVYVAPVHVESKDDIIHLRIYGVQGSRMAITGIEPPEPGGPARLRYVRLISGAPAAPNWASSGQVLYCNDAFPDACEDHLPFILGGSCTCTPSYTVLDDIQSRGYLAGMSLSQLEDLYRLEGIKIAGRDPGPPGRHVLEGGDWLFTPLPGTAGFARCYGQPHQPYRPRSREVRELAEEISRGAGGWADGPSGRHAEIATID